MTFHVMNAGERMKHEDPLLPAKHYAMCALIGLTYVPVIPLLIALYPLAALGSWIEDLASPYRSAMLERERVEREAERARMRHTTAPTPEAGC